MQLLSIGFANTCKQLQTLKFRYFDDDHISQVCDVCIFCEERWLAAAIDKFGASLMVRDEEAAMSQFQLKNWTQFQEFELGTDPRWQATV